ncbi:torsin-3A [Bufo gargarizans]|uniref:torsin-3A n=1 Tax=Bufo gargarizans TaxID=30331 RepID=UPI001CF54AD6|nr:torsin-3A [Bufo gargarizans]
MISSAPLLLLLLLITPKVHGSVDVLGLGELKGEDGEHKKDSLWLSGAQEVQDLAQLSWEYVQDLQCWLWPEKCEDTRSHTEWSWNSIGWDSLNLLTDLYAKVLDSTDFARGSITNNLTGLQWDMDRRVYGQHLAVRQIITSLTRFLQEDSQKKTLVLSFHGWTGTGKNLAARIIAENLYRDGQRSRCTKVFIPQLHFPHLSHVEAYKVQLRKQIQAVSSHCAQPLFVFDETDKLPAAFLQSLFPLLYPDETKDTRSIFIFLSGSGAGVINEVALNFWRAGRLREEITLDDLDRPLRMAIKQMKDQLLTQQLWMHNLIDEYVPFLPLERHHVKLCTRDAIEARGLPHNEGALDSVIQELLFVPKEEKIFSAQGCKQVAQRINFKKL